MKIGFYDSGLGGVKTLKDIIDMGLEEEIYFLADEKNKPYGIKSPEEVKKIAKENVQLLVDLGCEIVVVACNTATSVAITNLRQIFSGIEIIGTEPAVKPAIDEGLGEKVLVIATTITVKGEKLKKLIKKLHTEGKVDLLAADKLVTLIEDENYLKNQENVNIYLKNLLQQYNLKEFSHIILGCTHFPLVKDNIEMILKEQNLDLKVIDGNEGIGKNLFNKIKEKNGVKNDFKLHIIITAENEAFKKRTKEILENIDYSMETLHNP